MKYNLLSFDELVINIDRLSRFKLPEDSFYRVFSAVILKHLITPKYTKEELIQEDAAAAAEITEEIWNKSTEALFGKKKKTFAVNDILRKVINNTFCAADEKTLRLMSANLNMEEVLKHINYEDAPLNVKFLIKASEESTSGMTPAELREKYALRFPVSKLIIAEGITEEILLPVFADILNKNFNKKGIYILSAGGKSKSPAIYSKLKNRLKIPAVMLFDKDAQPLCIQLEKSLLNKDKCILIENGEFEDILDIKHIMRALNSEYYLSEPVRIEELTYSNKMCANIENFYRTRHLGEFKKSKFAKILSKNITGAEDITQCAKQLIERI